MTETQGNDFQAGGCGPTERKRLHVITWGCQMNVYDSGRMADVLAPLGYAPVAVPDDADMVILNTCHIREKAAEKVYSELGKLRVRLLGMHTGPDKAVLAAISISQRAAQMSIMAAITTPTSPI